MIALATARLAPWNDRTGRLSLFKLACLIATLFPAAYIFGQAVTGNLGERPFDSALLQTGLWVVRFLALTLAITPLRRALQMPKLLTVRRMFGVATAAYAVLHFSLYSVQQNLDARHIVSEIILRFYLTIGFVALAGLIALAATSTDSAIKRMGAKAWNRLHMLVYPIMVLGLVHFVLQSKRDVSQAFTYMGIFVLLMLVRKLDKKGTATVLQLTLLALGSGLATMFGEALWYHLHSGIPILRILSANSNWILFPRPGHWVFAAGMVLATGRLWKPAPMKRARATPAVAT
ncbi:MAG: ferric reductase-like transmembrane domain-containing protein [Hyphomicrobiales bacterium]|nr:ferric reductase-like transmembrane domain-containing protein [Hyphomicrobiales bacterium]